MKNIKETLKRLLAGVLTWQMIFVTVVVPLSVSVPNVASAADTAYWAATANINSGWTNPDYGHLSDNLRAVADSDSDVVEYKNFGFAIPAGSAIRGIRVRPEGYTSGTRQADVSLSWDNGVTYTTGSGLKTSAMPGSSAGAEDTRTLGDSTDLWNRSWTAEQFSNANFRVKLDANGGTSSLYIDQVMARVYYTPPPTCSTPTFTSVTGTHYVSGDTIYYSSINSTTGSFKVTVAATDTESGMDRVSFPTLMGFTRTPSAADDSASPYERTYSWSNPSGNISSAIVICYNDAGLSSTTTFNVVRDDSHPVISNLVLDKYAIKTGGTINVSATAIDAGSGIGACLAYLSTNSDNSIGMSDVALGDLGPTCSGNITIGATEGNYYIKLRIGDNVGHWPNPLVSSVLKVDNTAPQTSTDFNPPPGAHYYGSKTVNLIASDTGSGVFQSYYQIGVAGEVPLPNPSVTGTAGTAAAVTCPANTECTKLVFYASVDNAGNIEGTQYSYAITVINDSTPPTTTDDYGAKNGVWKKTDQLITLNPADNLSGVSSTKYCVDTANACTPTTDYGSAIQFNSEGDFYLRYYSTDNAGNSQNIVSRNVKIDKTAPIVNVINDIMGWTNLDVTANATTDHGSLSTSSHLFTANGNFDFVATDLAGNQSTVTHTVSEIDKTPPTSTVNSLSTYYNTSSISLPYTASDVSGSGIANVKLYYSWMGGAWFPYTTGTFSASPIVFDSSTTGGSGSYSFYTVATDVAGNVEGKAATSEASTVIDYDYPHAGLVMINPDYSPYVNGLGFDITAVSVYDSGPSDINPSSCEYTINGTDWYTATYISAIGICYQTGVTAPDSASLSIKFRVSDNAGNQTVGATVTRISDSLPPAVVSVDSDGERYSSSTTSPHEIRVTFNEAVTNTPTIEVHSIVVGPEAVSNCGDMDAKTFCFDYAVPALQEMTHTIWISGAQDAVGNTMVTDSSHTFNVDTLAPTTSANGGVYTFGDWSNTNVDVTLTPLDDGSGVHETYWCYDDGSSECIPNETGEGSGIYTDPLTFDADGEWFLRYFSVDLAGNSEGIQVKEIRVDKTVPTSSVNSLLKYINTKTFNLNVASDDASGSGVNHFEIWYRKNGGVWTSYGDYTTSPVLFDTLLTGGDGFYEFYSIATDNAENIEDVPSNQAIRLGYLEETTRIIIIPDAQTTVDTIAPVITLNGVTPMTIIQGMVYAEPGATVDDASTLSISGTVNTAILGSYLVRYNATDIAGNKAIEKARTVNVVSAPPIISGLLSLTGPAGGTAGGTAGEVLGTTTDQNETGGDKEIKGAESNNNSNGNSQNNETAGIFGKIQWYWWLLIILGIGGLGWWFLGWKRRKEEN